MSERKKIPFWVIAIVALVLAVGAGYVAMQMSLRYTQRPPQASLEIGGPFQLSSTAGNIVTDGTFRGRWVLLYFGATRCPENQCRKTLHHIDQAMNLLGDKALQVVPVFISMDTYYDSPSRLLLYMKSFSSKMTALVGGEYAIRDLSILYHVPIVKIRQNNGEYWFKPYDRILIMSPVGKYDGFISVDASPETIAQRVRNLLK